MAEETQSSERVIQVKTPLERDLARIGESFDSFKDDLIASGVSEEMIQATREHALARKQAEYKERQGQDPFVLIGNALTEAAQSDEEQALAHFHINGFERDRVDWQKKFHEAKIDYTRSGQGNLDTRGFLRSDSMRRESAYGKVGADIMRPASRKPLGLPGDEAELIIPSEEFQIKILRKLGVLGADETLDALRALPERPSQYDGPYTTLVPTLGEKKFTAMELPTNINGVRVAVHSEPKYPNISASLNNSAFGRVLNNTPTSPGKPV